MAKLDHVKELEKLTEEDIRLEHEAEDALHATYDDLVEDHNEIIREFGNIKDSYHLNQKIKEGLNKLKALVDDILKKHHKLFGEKTNPKDQGLASFRNELHNVDVGELPQLKKEIDGGLVLSENIKNLITALKKKLKVANLREFKKKVKQELDKFGEDINRIDQRLSKELQG